MASLPFRRRSRGNSMYAVTPPLDSPEYDATYATIATRILYQSPLPSQDDLPVYILDSAAFPDADEVHYNSLLPYVLARLPTSEELIGGKGYEVVFFAGGEDTSAGQSKKARPPWSWFLQAYQVLTRAMRKRLQKLYLVHERRWIRVMLEMFSTIVSPKFRRKIVHCSTLSSLALYIPIENLLIPPTAYDRDRHLSPDIHVPYATGRRAFGASIPLPFSSNSEPRLPRVLREASAFLLDDENVKCEGIFRVNARAQTLGVLREAYERGQKFIIWREGDRVTTFSHWQDGHGEVVVQDVLNLDGYGVYTAAGLIKMWYSKLKEPIFHEESYEYIEEKFGGQGEIETTAFLDFIDPTSETSILSRTARLILVMHLFPFLARVSQHSETNKMTSNNLAVCFAPALLCGGDPIRDAKISRILIQAIQYGVDRWDSELAKPCEMDCGRFEALLELPSSVEDREDPLDGGSHIEPVKNETEYGISMLDNDNSDDTEDAEKPPLPPRILTSTSPVTAEPIQTPVIRRKPVAAMRPPPRYSTIVSPQGDEIYSLPSYAERDPASNGTTQAVAAEASNVQAPLANEASTTSQPMSPRSPQKT